ncbi:MAG: nuclear transport factor 2 family protein [Nitrospirae bacterium]|nr:nuclear transport factor 2 family protein [Nitrospirota bacterium]
MKRLFLACLSIWALIALPGVAVAESDEAAIVRTIMESVNAFANFPQTKDHQTVARFYSKDYFGIQDGAVMSRSLLDKQLADMEKMLKDEIPMTIKASASNVRAESSGVMGWATYDVSIDWDSSGLPIVKGNEKCTSLLRKAGTQWQIQHDHCSSSKGQPEKAT